MVIGAIKVDNPAAGAMGFSLTVGHRMADGSNFAAVLIAADASFGAPAADDGGSAARAEISRSIAVLGNLRETTIRYADGSSDIRLIDIGANALMPARNIGGVSARPAAAAFKANSDLAPEIGIGGDPARQVPWRMRPVARPSTAQVAGRRRKQGVTRPFGDDASATDMPHDIGLGRLIDHMV